MKSLIILTLGLLLILGCSKIDDQSTFDKNPQPIFSLIGGGATGCCYNYTTTIGDNEHLCCNTGTGCSACIKSPASQKANFDDYISYGPSGVATYFNSSEGLEVFHYLTEAGYTNERTKLQSGNYSINLEQVREDSNYYYYTAFLTSDPESDFFVLPLELDNE